MGIRVHKAVGYGLDRLATENGRTTDHRFAPDMHRNQGNSAYVMDASKFQAWCQQNEGSIQELIAAENAPIQDKLAFFLLLEGLGDMIQRKSSWLLSRSFIWDDEFGLPNVLFLVDPTGYDECFRYDTILDWTEETDQYGSHNRVVRLKRPGIHPYDGRWKRIRPGPPGIWTASQTSSVTYHQNQCRFQDDHGPLIIGAQNYSFLTGRWDPGRVPPDASGHLLKHLIEDYRPTIPAGVLAVLHYYKDCFPMGLQPILDDMRSLLYVWWS